LFLAARAGLAQDAQPGNSASHDSAESAPAITAHSSMPVEAIRARLGDLQRRARQDPAIDAASDAFGAEVLAAMTRLDPQATPKTARANAIQTEAAQARASGDQARLNELAEEGQRLRAYFTELRARAMALPEVERSRQAFIARLFEKMTELDPTAPELVRQLDAARAGEGGEPPSDAQTPKRR
jgi:hypothetical protein